jgi:putative transcriptional regulator
MGEEKLRIADLARETGLNRNTITRLYHETATRVDLDTIETLCEFFDCGVGELFEYVPK